MGTFYFGGTTYQISFEAAQRYNQTGSQNFEILLDGTIVATFQPTSTSYQTYWTGAINVSSGSHTITFVGLNSAGGDHTALLDAVSMANVGPGAPTVGDANFEAVIVGSGNYTIPTSGSAWTFSNSGYNVSGVSGNNSPYTAGNAPAPEGNQVAYLEDQGTLSQSIAGWGAGTYQVSFLAAQRGNYAGNEDFQVLIDGSIIATIKPTDTTYRSYTTPSFAVSAGAHTLTFRGLDTAGNNDTAFLDAVRVSNLAAATWTVYNGTNPYADFDASGTLLNRYLTGTATDQYLARISASGTVAWYLTDHEGSVRDIANTLGSVIDHVAYDSYGNVTSESSPSSGDRFKFDGMAADAAIALYYDNARYYDSDTGRFINQDPTGFAAKDASLYRYVDNSPVDGTDATGNSDDSGSWGPLRSTKGPFAAPPSPLPGVPWPPFGDLDQYPTKIGFVPYDGPPLQGYIDINVGLFGVGGGVQVGSGPSSVPIYPYYGAQSPGVGISVAPGQNVSPGWNAAIGGNVAIFTWQGGVVKDPNNPGPPKLGQYFWEVGVGTPSPVPLAPSGGGGWRVIAY